MFTRLEVLLTPAEFSALPARDLRQSVCVVFDVLRATSTILEALANGAEAVLPVADIPDALEWRQRDPEVLLAGERDGLRIGASLAGGIEFDLGNSPREFTRERVAGRRIVMTTTNGTRALEAARGAAAVLAASLGNLGATARWLASQDLSEVVLIGAGTHEHSAWEDAVGVGALSELLWHSVQDAWVDDSARMTREIFRARSRDLAAALGEGRNGRRLLSLPELADDVAFCALVDRHDFVVLRGSDAALRPQPAPRQD